MEDKFKKLDELVKLALPLQEWLLKNYDPMCQIIISYGEVKVTRDECKGLLPVDEEE